MSHIQVAVKENAITYDEACLGPCVGYVSFQYVAVCCSVLQCVAVNENAITHDEACVWGMSLFICTGFFLVSLFIDISLF